MFTVHLKNGLEISFLSDFIGIQDRCKDLLNSEETFWKDMVI